MGCPSRAVFRRTGRGGLEGRIPALTLIQTHAWEPRKPPSTCCGQISPSTAEEGETIILVGKRKAVGRASLLSFSSDAGAIAPVITLWTTWDQQGWLLMNFPGRRSRVGLCHGHQWSLHPPPPLQESRPEQNILKRGKLPRKHLLKKTQL